MVICYGKFCGKFHDEHEGEVDDEDEVENDKSVYAHMVARTKENSFKQMTGRCRKSIAKMFSNKSGTAGQSAKLQWANHLTMTKALMKSGKEGRETLQKVAVLSAKKAALKESALSSIGEVGQVHTVDLEDCQIKEVPAGLRNVDTLVLLQLLHNKIRKVPGELGKCAKLETLNLAFNHISMLDLDLFGEHCFQSLEVISLRHNKLAVLPNKFGLTQGTCRIKHIDLSENAIQVLPESITNAQHLRFLDISHNRLTMLPKDFKFPKLEKLFMSFNQLVELPENIGECKALEKIRMTNCSVRRLPLSVLALWKDRSGMPQGPPWFGPASGNIVEFDVTGNPLVVPSITGFEMGGVEQLFKLLDDYVRHQAERRDKMPALTDAAGGAGQLEAAGDKLALADEQLAIEEAGEHHHHKHPEDDDDYYYFNHCRFDDEDNELPEDEVEVKIQEIRNAEATLLIIKKNTYFQSQIALAEEMAKGPGGKENVPKSLKEFLDPNFDVSKWHGVSHVTDLDLYFNLLVYSTKPLFSTAYTLFDKYETANLPGKDYLSKDEWDEFVMASPILLDDPKICEGMWHLMSWRFGDRIPMVDFIAAWHIHDIEKEDPKIARLCKVLQLDHYDMDLDELQNRLRSKDAEDATPQLNFDAPDSDEEEEDDENMIQLEAQEGERWVVPPAKTTAKKKEDEEESESDDEKGGANKHQLVSMTDAEYVEYMGHHGDEEKSDGAESDVSIGSDELSDEEDSDMDEFNVDDHAHDMDVTTGRDAHGNAIVVNSDLSIANLMALDPKNFFQKKQDAGAETKALLPHAQTHKKAKEKKTMADNRFKTDVFPVRQQIRSVYRNLPFDDFVKLISFLLRGMQQMGHSRKASTYWHADDPTFKFTMGVRCSNRYTRRLLQEMGFALVDHLYWVWPVVHMQEVSKLAHEGVPVWGEEDIPRNCLGRSEDRLTDMILLLRNCQKRVHKAGKSFNGNFP